VRSDVENHAGDAHEGGAGTPLLLLHGLTGTWHIWKPVLALLESRHRVIALTLPGHFGGPPLAPGVEPTVNSMADGVVEALRQRGLSSVHVAGNSLGGWLALELARRGVAKSVVAFSPAGGWETAEDYRAISKPFRVFFFLMPLVLLLTTLFLGWAALRRALGRQTMEHAERIEAGEFRDSLRAFSSTYILPALLQAMRREGPIASLDAPGVPIHIVWSACDRVIPFERYGKPMLRRVPQASFATLAAAGHVPMYDDPAGVAAEILAVTVAADRAPVAGGNP